MAAQEVRLTVRTLKMIRQCPIFSYTGCGKDSLSVPDWSRLTERAANHKNDSHGLIKKSSKLTFEGIFLVDCTLTQMYFTSTCSAFGGITALCRDTNTIIVQMLFFLLGSRSRLLASRWLPGHFFTAVVTRHVTLRRRPG